MVIMLGFVDQVVRRQDFVDWSTNKIGGFPNWVDDINLKNCLQCKLCSQSLYHLTQIYCPLQNSDYHRTLNVFGCTSRECWNKPESIVVLRSQLVVEKSLEEKKPIDQDDWGVNDWSNGSVANDDWGPSDEKPEDIEKQNGCSEESTPMNDVTSQIDELTVKDTCSEDTSHFTAYHIYVQSEDSLITTVSKDYEMQLYQDYVSREGEIKATSATCKNKKSETEGEKYEKTSLKHGDELFHQFKKRISNYPEQLIRYEWNGEPLLLSSRSELRPSFDSIPHCSNCQSPRVFELQLMPSLVNYLCEKKVCSNGHESKNSVNVDNLDETMEHRPFGIRDDENVRIEFGCIYVFSCSKACWEGNDFQYEFAVLQPDPDVGII